jgi:glycosyltransferase involved in cell wall biosynthesis
VGLTDIEDVRRFTAARRGLDMVGLAATTRVREAVVRKRPARREQVAVVPLGIPGADEPACLAEPDREPTAILTAPMTRDGGLDLVLKALHTMSKNGQDVQLFILSAGKAERLFRRQAEQLRLRSQVTFAGAMRDRFLLTRAMRSADFYVVPAPCRRFQDTTLMAMAAGLAILAPTGTLEDYLIDGETARLFEPNRADDLARKWGALLEDRGAARQLAHGALDYVRAHHQASKMVSAAAALYRQLCA